MAIMSHKEWMRRTNAGPLKPRSRKLKFLDEAVKAYGLNRGRSNHIAALKTAFIAWADGKDDAYSTVRNRDGAITDLMNQILDFEDDHMPAAHMRPRGHLKDIREGARLMAQGNLKSHAKVKRSNAVTDKSRGHVVYEEFSSSELVKAKKAWADAYRCADMAVRAISRTLNDPKEEERFRRWFGPPNRADIAKVSTGLRKLQTAFHSNKVTLVNRPDIRVHLVNGHDPVGDMTPHFSGQDVYGYVWSGDHAGSGYRVIMGSWFLGDPDPIEGAAQTVYHELTHKVLETVDHVYGKIGARGLAVKQSKKAKENADNWAFYAVSFIKNI